MDHNSIHGQDVTNFSAPSPHRMPTVSAAQALQDTLSLHQQSIPTGLGRLDVALQNQDVQIGSSTVLCRGIVRGKVTEIYGPPGVGKTALGMQLAVNALRSDQTVVWVDAANPLPSKRLAQLLNGSTVTYEPGNSSSPIRSTSVTSFLSNFVHLSTPTLPHLVALLCHPSPTFPPEGTSLVVVDSLSALISIAYPRASDAISTPRKPGTAAKYDAQHWASTRKWAVLQYLISAFQKLATIRNIAVVITNQTVTKMQLGLAAMLVPAITSTAWDAGIAARIMLYRDWGWNSKPVRFAAVLKAEGVATGCEGGVGTVTAFTIGDGGLEEMQITDRTTLPDGSALATPSRKRKRNEIGDSEDEDDLEGSDEDYGWANEDDEELPEPPPQWQGSEDILIVHGDDGDEDAIDDNDEQQEE